jgi:hypothetical protein
MDNSTRINSTLDDNKEEATVKEVKYFPTQLESRRDGYNGEFKRQLNKQCERKRQKKMKCVSFMLTQHKLGS